MRISTPQIADSTRYYQTVSPEETCRSTLAYLAYNLHEERRLSQNRCRDLLARIESDSIFTLTNNWQSILRWASPTLTNDAIISFLQSDPNKPFLASMPYTLLTQKRFVEIANEPLTLNRLNALYMQRRAAKIVQSNFGFIDEEQEFEIMRAVGLQVRTHFLATAVRKEMQRLDIAPSSFADFFLEGNVKLTDDTDIQDIVADIVQNMEALFGIASGDDDL